MKKFKHLVFTAFLGGLVVILPVVILLKLFIWLLNWITGIIQPLTGFIIATTQSSVYAAELISLSCILLACFLTGLLVRTAWGNWVHGFTERWFLERLPGYKMLKEIFTHLKPEENRSFSKPVMISLDKSKNYFMGFITDQYGDDQYAVFIPTSPSPVNGFVVQTSGEHLKFLDTDTENVMKTVISCGVGSANLMEKIQSRSD